MNKPEILAPVGGAEQLKAAVRCGADAVYLGTSDFNARRNADNFGEFELDEAVKYCHLRGVKVYVTLNTLVFDRELPALYETAKRIAESGADAVILQDFAAINAIKEICPELRLHASTQMAVHNVSGAKMLEKFGFSRIVLAREMSLNEIKAVRNAVSAELEVFVHGAHCMAASGNCYLSAMLGERSGNRGLCAQGCRLDWRSQHGRSYALSLKDMSYMDSIGELTALGVQSYKIEGRMTRPEYVAAAVTSLKNAINGEEYDRDTLRSVFSRSGFTDGYLKAERNINMFGTRGKDDVTAASSEVLKGLTALYSTEKKILSADFTLEMHDGVPSSLTAKCADKAVTVTGALPVSPLNAPLAKETALRNISKLGDTPFNMGDFEFSNSDEMMLPSSAVNDLRRRACSELENALTASSRVIKGAKPPVFDKYTPDKSGIRVRLAEISQYSDELNGAQAVIISVDEILKNENAIRKIKPKIIAELPDLVYPAAEAELESKLKKLKAMGITDGASGNIGGIKLLKELGFTVHGLHGLNIVNTPALMQYEAFGLTDVTLSFELSAKSAAALGGSIKRGAIVYGYLPLMLMRCCPQKSADGCKKCSGRTFLTDRKGVKFPVICHGREYSVLHNSVPLYVGNKPFPPLDFYTLYFTSESTEECARIYNCFLNGADIGTPKTNGIYFRELL